MKNNIDSDALGLNKQLQFESDADGRKEGKEMKMEEQTEVITGLERKRKRDGNRETDGLTGAAEALLAYSEQHGMAVVTVGWFVEVLQTPNMLPVLLYVLQGDKEQMKHHNVPFSSSSSQDLSYCTLHVRCK